MKVSNQLRRIERELRGIAIALVADPESTPQAMMTVVAIEAIQKLGYEFRDNWIGEHEQWPESIQPEDEA